MGGSSGSSNQVQTSTPTPWGPGAAAVQSSIGQLGGLANLTGTEQSAFAGLTGPTSGILSGYLPQQQNVASQLYSGGQNFAPMVSDAYKQYQQQLSPYLQSSFLDPRNTPGFGNALAATNADITNQINSQFAGAGRDLSGLNTQNLARGLGAGEGGLIANQYNQNVQNQLGAMNSLYGAGGNTAGLLSGLQQTQFGNMQAGQGAAQGVQDVANSPYIQQLAAEAQKRGISTQALLAQAGVALPAAQAFGTTTTTGTGQQQQQMSPAQLYAALSGATFGNKSSGLLGGVGQLAGGIGALMA